MCQKCSAILPVETHGERKITYRINLYQTSGLALLYARLNCNCTRVHRCQEQALRTHHSDRKFTCAESRSHFDSTSYTRFMSNIKSCWADIVMSEFAVFQVQANNYATFYDDQMQNWSVMFESSDDAKEFAREVSRTGTL